jgi:hypothetical protein
MIYIFGDSHANFSMNGFDLPHVNLHQNSVTMHRIGRDNIIINFNSMYNIPYNTFILFYGEVDCRCHVGKQILLGRTLEDIVEELVGNYFRTIKNNMHTYNKIIISSITPPVSKLKYESIHGPIRHEFPFIGSDEERVLYTKTVNAKLKQYCEKYGYIFFDTYDYYSDNNGLLIFEKSDTNSHIKENTHILEKIRELL